MQVNGSRLIGDLRALAEIGRYQTGVDRTAFSADDIRARRWLSQRLTEAGLDAAMDRVGNVLGRMPGAERAILIGSHTDTVPKGGWLDGSMGVVYGLEIARCLMERRSAGGVTGRMGVDVVSFQDEEGTFQALLGAATFCGDDVGADPCSTTACNGAMLERAISEAGLAGNPALRLDLQRHVAYLEAHIEQGPRLEAAGLRLGVVSAIVGQRSFRILFRGRADHAGTTPMDMRSDAGAAAVGFAAAIAKSFRGDMGPDTVWNLGGCTFRPGAANVVPAEADLAFQLRCSSAQRIARMQAMVHDIAGEAARAAGVEAEVTCVLAVEPTPMDVGLRDTIAAAAEALGVAHMTLSSGAGHDAVVLARHVPTAMLFVPSIGGRSHNVSEDTTEADIVLGAQVMLTAVLRHIESFG